MSLRPRWTTAACTAAFALWLTAAPAATAADEPSPSPTDDGRTSVDGAAAAGQDLVSFGIAPAGPERADERPFVSVEAPPGSVIYDHVAILNQDDQPIDLDVYAGDVIMADGGLSVRARADRSTDAGSWITVDGPTSVTVPAQTADEGYGYTIVPIAISIPTDAQPGDHIGGVVASLVTAAAGGVDTPNIELEQRVAARIYIRVDGDLAPGLVITNVSALWAAGSLLGDGAVEVTYTLRNTGTMRMAVEPEVSVAGPLGLVSRTAPGDRVDELPPRSETTVTTTVTDVWALIRHSVTIDAVVVAPTAGENPGLGTVSTSVVLWAVPWLAIGVLLACVALVVFGVRRRRRRRRVRAAAPGTRRSRRNGVSGPTGSTPVEPSPASTDHVPAGADRP